MIGKNKVTMDRQISLGFNDEAASSVFRNYSGLKRILVNHSKGIISKEEYGLNDPPPFDDSINQLSNNLVFRTDLKVRYRLQA